MSDQGPFASAPNETHTQIMRATYEALRKHGYSELTIQRIGDEFPKSKSLIYQHYDGKDELLVAFLEFLLERFRADVPTEEFDDAREHLETIIDHGLPESLGEEDEAFTTAVEALRGQAPHDETYREQYARINEFYRERTADVIHRGIEQGVFREVDPEQAAGFIVATIHGARSQRVSTGDHEPVLAARRELEEYVRTRLLVEENR
ncbi:TetR/AcrR family transcriptional regulator [Natronobacterium texcoconense]|uniref:DNA-binding transcriptional regulator, AcrR family n=1 Tax=Natronobacterium texcoconense TaxID=1095778 RepID=A0A1H1HXV1_NATTX|nr:TetR/AcrR family transcriptional regulator [Natronobacterium texcoconense]SDR30274.1 DNA-binding transcriptional regulator, AcrR family [Natronobacterium texcoconense]